MENLESTLNDIPNKGTSTKLLSIKSKYVGQENMGDTGNDMSTSQHNKDHVVKCSDPIFSSSLIPLGLGP